MAALSTHGRHSRGQSGPATRPCSPWRSRRGAGGDLPAEVTPGLLERGVEIEEELGLELEYNDSPSFVACSPPVRQGETDQARALLEELEAKAAARGDDDSREGPLAA